MSCTHYINTFTIRKGTIDRDWEPVYARVGAKAQKRTFLSGEMGGIGVSIRLGALTLQLH